MSIWAYTERADDFSGRSAEVIIYASVQVAGRGKPLDIEAGQPKGVKGAYRFLRDDGSESTFLGSDVAQIMGLRMEEGIAVGGYTPYGGPNRPTVIFDTFMYLSHRQPRYRFSSTKDYSLFRVHASVDFAVFKDPTGEGARFESLIGQDILDVLRREGNERTQRWTDGIHSRNRERREWARRRSKVIIYDIKPNYRIRRGRPLFLSDDLHDTRNPKLRDRELREMLGLSQAQDSDEPE